MTQIDKSAPQLTDIHTALQRAVVESQTESQMKNCTFKVLPSRKILAEEICSRHGTTLSTFLRQCVNSLILDYVSEQDLVLWEKRKGD